VLYELGNEFGIAQYLSVTAFANSAYLADSASDFPLLFIIAKDKKLFILLSSLIAKNTGQTCKVPDLNIKER